VGSAGLQPEFSRQYDAGLTYQKYFNQGALRQISMQHDAYYNQVNNKILAVPGQNLRRWVMENIGRVNIKGMETNAQLTWLLHGSLLLNTALSYTYQQARDVSVGSFTNGQIPYTPVHSGSARAGLLWQQWSLNYGYIYTGQRYSQKANIPENYVAPWYTHDASVIWQPVYRGHRLNIAAEVNNLLNQYYDVISNFPMPGRSYRLKLSINI
jgi:vitamin B12 transporter